MNDHDPEAVHPIPFLLQWLIWPVALVGSVTATILAPRWGIDPDCVLFICPGVPFKYAPQHDSLLVEIARRTKRCRFVFFDFADQERRGIPNAHHRMEDQTAWNPF